MKLLYSAILCLIIQSCDCCNHDTSNVYSETQSIVYQNHNKFDLVGLNGVSVCERNGGHNEKSYSVMLDILTGSGMTHARIEEEDIAPLRCFLDSCISNSHKLTWEESFQFKKGGKVLFATSSDKVEDHLLFCRYINCYIDMIVSFEKFDSIMEDAEQLIEEKKKEER